MCEVIKNIVNIFENMLNYFIININGALQRIQHFSIAVLSEIENS